MDDQKGLEALLRWGAEVGISDSPHSVTSPISCLGHSLSISNFPEAGGGLAAARELRCGELILRVPRKALMNRESLRKDGKLTPGFQRYPHLTSTQVLTVYLLAEVGKGSSSWWYPYLVQLPRTYDILATFNQFEIQALQVADAISASKKSISKLQFEWKETQGLMKEINLKPQLLSFQSWLWASATISSRTLHIPWDDAGCLCPVGDLFNYDAPEMDACISGELETKSMDQNSLRSDINIGEDSDAEECCENFQRLVDGGFEEDVGAYCFYARKRYKRGEQVFLCYGTYTNLELLEHYGFLLSRNPGDKIPILVGEDTVQINDSLHIQQDGRPSFSTLCALRLLFTPQKLRKAAGRLAYSGIQLSRENETSAMSWVVKKCHGLLQELPTTLEEDGLLLKYIENMLKYFKEEDKKPSNGSFLKWATEEKQGLGWVSEMMEFLEMYGLKDCFISGERKLSRRLERSLRRWRMAVQWRLMYKKTLCDCVIYCTGMIQQLSSQSLESRGAPLLQDVKK
ncbi:protein SET DOMAIN GROUP 40 isoform X2 [Amborella trichopoda]|uniref:protein SET DOMAIN GROUP 40 isoform X2 n=1 Tax=Amborella trichopoda TaxID=13333 RepID=UPI0009C0967A|nr:protein SET DOMAIN GROUP 40 isoform X2 [Amborella trichopoda]|eukprot:XP_020529971.1 protein SET DOMAIN GROUP 40 isoform X2 [Amborella trichopoda]